MRYVGIMADIMIQKHICRRVNLWLILTCGRLHLQMLPCRKITQQLEVSVFLHSHVSVYIILAST